MFPTLLNIGPLSISSFGVCTAISLVLGAFLVWRKGRDRGISDEKILDNIVVTVALTLIMSRIVFVMSHWSDFSPSFLRMFLVWKFSGFSTWGAFIGGLCGIFVFGHKQKLNLSVLLDSYGLALPLTIFIMSLAVFLDGTVTGKVSTLPWALVAVGISGKRHPIGVYGIILAIVSGIFVYLMQQKVNNKTLKRGSVGLTALFGFAVIQLILAFLRDDLLYFAGFSIELLLAGIISLLSIILLVIVTETHVLFVNILKLIQSKIKK